MYVKKLCFLYYHDGNFIKALNKKKTKEMFAFAVINSEVHAFLCAHYIENKYQGKKLWTPFHYQMTLNIT